MNQRQISAHHKVLRDLRNQYISLRWFLATQYPETLKQLNHSWGKLNERLYKSEQVEFSQRKASLENLVMDVKLLAIKIGVPSRNLEDQLIRYYGQQFLLEAERNEQKK